MDAPLETLRRQRHELYIRMIRPSRAWIESRNELLPGSLIEWSENIRLQDFVGGASSPRRHDATLLDEIVANVDRRGGTAAGAAS